MSDWLHGLSFGWLIVIVFAFTYAVAALTWWVVTALATGDRGRGFQAVSPGMLPPLGVIFGLLVGFLAAGVWSDSDRAQQAVNREASALRSAVLLAESFPGEPEAKLRLLVRRHIQEAATKDWPEMGEGKVTLTVIPASLAEALRLTLALKPEGEGQRTAQRELVSSLQNALDARRQRIIVSESRVNWVKWTGLALVGLLTLLAVAFVHSGNRLGAGLAMWIFASAVALSIVLIASQDRPFAGPLRIGPDVLTQVMPTG